jgi:serine protein kinase
VSDKNLLTSLEKYAKEYRECEEHMSLGEFLVLVKKKPHLAALAHKRVYDMIRSYGVQVDPETQEERYLFFETELFGVEDSMRQVVEYFKGASLGSDVGRRFLMLYGPPASGKSCLLTMLKDALEKWTMKDEGAVYAIEGCPMHENPLHAIPNGMRKEVEKELGIKVEGELCPVCAEALRNKFAGDFMKFGVKRVYFSQQARMGIGTFVPSDPKSQDLCELVGSVDLSKVGEYGAESDPRAYRFDGELNIANRGIMEFIEILKVDQKFLYVLLTATQEKNIKTPRFPLLYCDEVILSHTNEAEYKDFVGNPKNEALIDRMIVCRVKYNLKVGEEIKIYEKLLRQGDTGNLHVAPHTLKVAAMFAVLSRLEQAKDSNLDKVKKMKLYNGEDVEGYSQKDVRRLMRENVNEGMDGLSPRYIINRLITTAIRAPKEEAKQPFITPVDVLYALKDGLETSSKIKSDERAKFEELLQLARVEFDQIARNEVQKAFFVSFQDEAQTLLDNYLDHVEAYLDKTKLIDPITKDEVEPDEKLMRSIESKIGIGEGAKDSFRNEIMRKVGSAAKRGEKFCYANHARLREAIEKQLFEERRDTIKMTITSRSKNPEELKRINEVVKTLCDKYGYIPESANELLKYVSSLMTREK